MKRGLLLILAVCLPLPAWSAAAREETALARSEYLAQRGTIIPVHEVRIDEFIGAVDYAYPDPEGPFGVYVYTGHQQVSMSGQSEVLVVGVQGHRYRFEDLPPMNLVVVVDTSGSMREPDKLEWVKESLLVLLDTLRDKDYLSLVLFDAEPHVLLPPTRLGEGGPERLRSRLGEEIRVLSAGGESNIVEALAAGFREAAVHFIPGGTNRVLLLTDGWGRTRGIKKLVKANRERGVEISVIGYGENFESNFAREIFELSGGGSRFVSDRERMEEIFGSGLARTAVPLARNIRIELVVEEAQATQAWGLDPSVHYFWDQEEQRYTSRINLTVPIIHNGDYETAVAMLQLRPSTTPGRRRLLSLRTLYTDLAGEERELEPQEVEVDIVPAQVPVAGFSDARVLRAGTMLRYALELQRISGTYYADSYYGGAYYGGPAGPYQGDVYRENAQLYQAFFRSYEMKKELKNAATRLGNDSFADEIAVLENYLRITGEEIGFKETIVEQIIADNELRPPVPERPLEEHLDYLFRELALDLEKKPPGNLAVSGFSLAGTSGASLVEVLNEAGATFLRTLSGSTHPLVERQRMDEILREQELALSDLVDPQEALSVGQVLAAHYLLTGTVIPMSESVVVFARILNVESAVVESVAQVIVARGPEVDSLL
jgi:hypothetical protein